MLKFLPAEATKKTFVVSAKSSPLFPSFYMVWFLYDWICSKFLDHLE